MPHGRPEIPAELQRRLLIEASHECAIPLCRERATDFAHIVPYSEVQVHHFENMIVLCPTHHRVYDRGQIDRPSIRFYKERLQRLLSGLREPTETTHQIRRRSIVVSEVVDSRERSDITTDVVMEALTDNVADTLHLTYVDESTPDVSVRPQLFEFFIIAGPAGTSVRAEVVLNRDDHFRFLVRFEPALASGEVVHYRYRVVRETAKPLFFEDAEARVAARTYNYPRPIVPAIEFGIFCPTDELIYETTLPPGYEITDTFIDVRDNDRRTRIDREVMRVKREAEFYVAKRDGRVRVGFRIPSPKPGCGYFVFYTPPRSA